MSETIQRTYISTRCEHGHTEPHVHLPPSGSYPPGEVNLTAAPWQVCWPHTDITEDAKVAFEAWCSLMESVDLTSAVSFSTVIGAESILRFFFTRILALEDSPVSGFPEQGDRV